MDVREKVLKTFGDITENTARVASEMTGGVVAYGNLVTGGKKLFSKKSVTCLCIGAEERFNNAWVVFRLKNDKKVMVMSGKAWREQFPCEEYESQIHL